MSKDRGDIEIPYVPFLIGKHREMNDFILDYPTVSRLHLRIDQKEDVYIFTDMNSTNGTMVNGYAGGQRNSQREGGRQYSDCGSELSLSGISIKIKEIFFGFAEQSGIVSQYVV